MVPLLAFVFYLEPHIKYIDDTFIIYACFPGSTHHQPVPEELCYQRQSFEPETLVIFITFLELILVRCKRILKIQVKVLTISNLTTAQLKNQLTTLLRTTLSHPQRFQLFGNRTFNEKPATSLVLQPEAST